MHVKDRQRTGLMNSGSTESVYMSLIIIALLSIALTSCSGGGTTGTPSVTAGAQRTILPLTAIRMLDQVHGWGLTQTAILRTADGGRHWKNVAPTNTTLSMVVTANFLDDQDAWVLSPQQRGNANAGIINVLHTADGGSHWTIETIHDPQAFVTDRPHFVDPEHGWLLLATNGGAGAGNEGIDIFRTNNGGQQWEKIATSGQQAASGIPGEGVKSGLTFQDQTNGWLTGSTAAIDHPWTYITHDGGRRWQEQALPLVPGLSNANYTTTPPVFSGSDGLLPVQVEAGTKSGLDLYITHDNGAHWNTTTPTAFRVSQVYALDMQHIWATDINGTFYATSDGGNTWSTLASGKWSIGAMSFVDANDGWAIGGNNDIQLLLHTSDGGKSWQQIHYVLQ